MIAECQEGILLLAREDGSRPDGSFFLHRMTGEHELPQAGSPLTGGRYSLEIKRRVALCGARESAAPAAGAKRKGHLRFPFLFGLLPFPCQLVWRRLPTCDRCEMGERQRIFSSVSFSTYSQCQIHYCYTDRLLCAGCGITVPHDSLAGYDRQGLRR